MSVKQLPSVNRDVRGQELAIVNAPGDEWRRPTPGGEVRDDRHVAAPPRAAIAPTRAIMALDELTRSILALRAKNEDLPVLRNTISGADRRC